MWAGFRPASGLLCILLCIGRILLLLRLLRLLVCVHLLLMLLELLVIFRPRVTRCRHRWI